MDLCADEQTPLKQLAAAAAVSATALAAAVVKSIKCSISGTMLPPFGDCSENKRLCVRVQHKRYMRSSTNAC